MGQLWSRPRSQKVVSRSKSGGEGERHQGQKSEEEDPEVRRGRPRTPEEEGQPDLALSQRAREVQAPACRKYGKYREAQGLLQNGVRIICCILSKPIELNK